tara:strand:+ start:637 stop:873 length:237 start_codon:yes stop_codon:yes gene_type:complete
MKVTEKESIIWASGHYLTNHLPNDYDEWEEEELNRFLEDNACFVVEWASPNYIWEFIDALAYDFRGTVNKKIEEVSDE